MPGPMFATVEAVTSAVPSCPDFSCSPLWLTASPPDGRVIEHCRTRAGVKDRLLDIPQWDFSHTGRVAGHRRSKELGPPARSREPELERCDGYLVDVRRRTRPEILPDALARVDDSDRGAVPV